MRPSIWKVAATVAGLLAACTIPLAAEAAASPQEQSAEELRDTVINLLQALVEQGVISKEKAQELVEQARKKASADLAARAQEEAAKAKEEQGAVRVPYVPEIVKQEISKQVAQEVRPAVTEDVLKEAKSEGWGIPGALPEWLKRVKLTGEITVRGQADLYGHGNDTGCPPGTLYGNCSYLDVNAVNTAGSIAKLGSAAFLNINQDRWRMRLRARIAAEIDLDDSWHAGVRLASGSLTDPSSESQTVGSEFGRYTVGFDEIYIRYDGHTASKFSYLTVNTGRFLNPFFSPTELVYANQLAFDGTAATTRVGLGGSGPDQSNIFLTFGGFPVQEIPLVANNDKWLVGAQFGAALRWGEGQRLTLAGAYYDFIRVEGVPNPLPIGNTINNYTAPAFVRSGNSIFEISNDPTVDLLGLAARFRVADVAGRYSLPVGRYVFAVDAEAARNIGYNETEILARTGLLIAPRTHGYVADVSFGNPTTTYGLGSWRALFGYRYVQRDAVLDALTDADFHEGGTNAEGYFVAGDLGVGEHVWVRMRYMPSKEIDAPRYRVDIWQLDLNTRF